MTRKTITDTARAAAPVAVSETPSLSDIIRAGAIALDIADADVDMLEGLVIDGQVYDLAETPELANAIRGMYVDDPDPVVAAAAGSSQDQAQHEDMGV